MPKITKESRIKEELDRLNVFFEKIDGNQRAAVKNLIQNAAFMKVTLEDLQDDINQSGAIDSYQNGANQSGFKQSATLQAYNALIKNYASVIKTLAGLLPPEKKPKPDALQAFLDEKPKTPEQEWIDEQMADQREELHQQWLKKEMERALQIQRAGG